MTLLDRGIQSFVLLGGRLMLIAGFWLTSISLYGSSLDETGWPVLVGIAILLLGGAVTLRGLFAVGDRHHRSISACDWNSRK